MEQLHCVGGGGALNIEDPDGQIPTVALEGVYRKV